MRLELGKRASSVGGLSPVPQVPQARPLPTPLPTPAEVCIAVEEQFAVHNGEVVSLRALRGQLELRLSLPAHALAASADEIKALACACIRAQAALRAARLCTTHLGNVD